MSTSNFAGRAEAYTTARPGYPAEALSYIHALAPAGAIFADVGAGTGKFTALLSAYGNEVYAVEPDADMRGALAHTLSAFPNTRAINGSAEATTLLDNSVDVITAAQALNWFDIVAFRTECLRIGKPNPLVVALYNDERVNGHSAARYQKSTGALFSNPDVRTFPNPTGFTRARWQLYHASMAGVPNENDADYEAYFDGINAEFDLRSVNGILCLDLVTTVYSERL